MSSKEIQPAKKCPSCTLRMNPYDHNGVTIDCCPGCHGLWFDPGELKRVVGNPVEFLRQGELLEIKRTRGRCPTCGDELVERAIIAGGSLRIDVCPQCEGAFLDSGELTKVRQVAAKRLGFIRKQDAKLLAEVGAIRREQRRAFQARPPIIEVEAAHSSERNFIAYLLGIPLEEDSSVESAPLMVYGLIGFLVLVWLWQVGTGIEQTIGNWGLVPDSIRAGEGLASLVTSNFLHAGWIHIAVNLYGLWIFGKNVENRTGPVAFLLFFLLWGLVGSTMSVFLTVGAASSLPHIGASGAVAGAMGAYAVLFPHNRFVFPVFGLLFLGVMMKTPAWFFVGFWAAVQLLSGWLALPEIAWWDHLGGFLGGLAVGFGYRLMKR